MTNQEIKEKQAKLIAEAKKLLGTSYSQLRCGAATKLLYGQINIALPILAIHQALCGREIWPAAMQFEAGDLFFFRGKNPYRGDILFAGRDVHIGHVSMYMGDGKIFESSAGKGRVVVRKLTERRIAKILLIRRLLNPN